MSANSPAAALAILLQTVSDNPPAEIWNPRADLADERAEDRKWERRHGRGDDARAEREYERELDRRGGSA